MRKINTACSLLTRVQKFQGCESSLGSDEFIFYEVLQGLLSYTPGIPCPAILLGAKACFPVIFNIDDVELTAGAALQEHGYLQVLWAYGTR
jgi:hypothetical protein